MIANGALISNSNSQPPYLPGSVLIYSCNAGYAATNPLALNNECMFSSSSSSSFWKRNTSELMDVCQSSK